MWTGKNQQETTRINKIQQESIRINKIQQDTTIPAWAGFKTGEEGRVKIM